MSDSGSRTTSRVIPRPGPHDNIPLLTEVVELPADALAAFEAGPATVPASAPLAPPVPSMTPTPDDVIDTAALGDTGLVSTMSEEVETPAPDAIDEPAAGAAGDEDDLQAVRTELLTRVMMRFRTEWPQVVEAHTEATLQSRLAPVTAQLASELTQALEARLVEWLDATLAEMERHPGGS